MTPAALNSYYFDTDTVPDVVNLWAMSIDVAFDAVVTSVRNTHYFDSPCSGIVNGLLSDSFDCS